MRTSRLGRGLLLGGALLRWGWAGWTIRRLGLRCVKGGECRLGVVAVGISLVWGELACGVGKEWGGVNLPPAFVFPRSEPAVAIRGTLKIHFWQG